MKKTSMYALHTFFYCSFSTWGIVELQWCVNFCCKAKGFSYIYILFKNILFHYGLILGYRI